MKLLSVKEPGCEAIYIVPVYDIVGIIEGFFENSDPGDKCILEIVEMSQEEFENIPEFEGC